MTTPISPALTAAEWAKPADEFGQTHHFIGEVMTTTTADGKFFVNWDGAVYNTAMQDCTEQRHALAALALHNQPFGFTWADVEALDEAIEDQRDSMEGEEDTTLGEHHLRRLESLRDRIAALLPPEGE